MDGGTIQQALLMILNVVIAALVSALTALGVSYFRTRGQNLATKHDFDELLRQLRTNTEAVEAIKSEVGQRDWARREWTNLRRIKLEALLDKMHDCEELVRRQEHLAVRGEFQLPERDYIGELDTIATLYFPELRMEAALFRAKCRELLSLNLVFGTAVREAATNTNALERATDTFDEKKQKLYGERVDARNALRAAARSLLERIMNVDQQTSPSDER